MYFIHYFPPDTSGNSPLRDLRKLRMPKEAGDLLGHLEELCGKDRADWCLRGNHCKIWKDDIYQVWTHSLRAHFVVDGQRMVVLNMFKKQTNKTELSDGERSKKRADRYFESVGKKPAK